MRGRVRSWVSNYETHNLCDEDWGTRTDRCCRRRQNQGGPLGRSRQARESLAAREIEANLERRFWRRDDVFGAKVTRSKLTEAV